MNNGRISINAEAMRRVTEQERVETDDIERAMEDAIIAHGHAVVVINEDGSGSSEATIAGVASQAEVRAKAEAEAQRQRDLDAAMTDTVTIVERMRQRLGRRPWSTSDGATINKIFALLKSMNGIESDTGFGG